MSAKLLFALILAAAVTLAGPPRSLMAADDAVFFANDMDVGIKGVFCAGNEDAGRLVFGPIGAKSSGFVQRSALPPRAECERLYVHMEDGAGWQFREPYYEEYYTDVLIRGGKLLWPDSSDAPYVRMTYSGKSGEHRIGLPPGLPLQTLAKYMRLGMRESDWERIAVPGLSPERRGEYALRDGPWSLAEPGIVFKEIAPGQRIVTQIEFVFSGSTFYPDGQPGFSRFSSWLNLPIQEGYTPWLFVWNGTTLAFTEQGKALTPDASPLPEAIAGGRQEQWEAFADSFCAVFALDRKSIPKPESEWLWEYLFDYVWQAIGGKIVAIPPNSMNSGLMVFGDEYTRLELELPIGTQKAVLRIIRNDGAALVGGR